MTNRYQVDTHFNYDGDLNEIVDGARTNDAFRNVLIIRSDSPDYNHKLSTTLETETKRGAIRRTEGVLTAILGDKGFQTEPV